MPMNRVPWSLQNNVRQVIKNPSAQVPWVPEHSSALWGSERLECLSSLSVSSGLRAGEPLVLEWSSAYRLPKKFPNGTNVWIIVCPNKKICQIYCVKRIIFVPKYLDKNWS